MVIELFLFQQEVEFVIAEDALRPARSHELLHQGDHGRAVGPPVHQIADKHQSPLLRVSTVFVVAEMPQQRHQRVDFAVYIADDINRTIEHRLNERIGHGEGYSG